MESRDRHSSGSGSVATAFYTLNHAAFCSIIKTTTCNYGQRDINVGLHRTWDVLINTLRYSTVYLWARCNTSFIMYGRIMNAGCVCVVPTTLSLIHCPYRVSTER